MGVDAMIVLPGDVRVDNVADVMGVLAGLEVYEEPLEGTQSNVTRVLGTDVKPTTSPGMVTIFLRASEKDRLIDGEVVHHVFYHFETDDGASRLMLPPSTAFWIAVGKRLVDFFGGELTFTDYDADTVNYLVPRKNNSLESNAAWDKFQKRLLNLVPLTEADLDEMEDVAAYDTPENRRSKVVAEEEVKNGLHEI